MTDKHSTAIIKEEEKKEQIQPRYPLKALKVKIIGGYTQAGHNNFEFTTKKRQFSLQSDRSLVVDPELSRNGENDN